MLEVGRSSEGLETRAVDKGACPAPNPTQLSCCPPVLKPCQSKIQLGVSLGRIRRNAVLPLASGNKTFLSDSVRDIIHMAFAFSLGAALENIS